MHKEEVKRFDIILGELDYKQTKSEEFDLDSDAVSVTGVLISSDRDDLLFYRGTQKIEIDGKTIIPENYESKLLMTGINVSPSARYYDLERVPVKSGKVKLIYTDNDHSWVRYESYRVSLYVRYEIKDTP